MHCQVPGCAHRVSRFRANCNTHHSRQRRHGHPEQPTITKADLKTYLRLVRARIERNAGSSLWPKIEARWQILLGHCRAVIAAYERGQPSNRFDRAACHELLKIADHVKAAAVIETVLAIYLLAEHDPRRFKSDEAFRVQLARRVRGLTEVNAGAYYDHNTGRTKRVYRELTPKAALHCGHMLAEVLGPVGLYLARLERQDIEAKRTAKSELNDALLELK